MGMSPEQARAALGRRVAGVSTAFGPSCGYAHVPNLAVGTMFIDYKVARIDVEKGCA